MGMAIGLARVFSPFRRLFGRSETAAQTVLPPYAPEDNLPVVEDYAAPQEPDQNGHIPQEDFVLVQKMTRLMSLTEIERHLPNILGRALARGWIDKNFQSAFMEDPKAMLSTYDVHLPDAIAIEVETEPGKRPRIVVYERTVAGTKRRLLYLQLVMMAGR